MEPFDDPAYNKFEITQRSSKAEDGLNYEGQLCYDYDNQTRYIMHSLSTGI